MAEAFEFGVWSSRAGAISHRQRLRLRLRGFCLGLPMSERLPPRQETGLLRLLGVCSRHCALLAERIVARLRRMAARIGHVDLDRLNLGGLSNLGRSDAQLVDDPIDACGLKGQPQGHFHLLGAGDLPLEPSRAILILHANLPVAAHLAAVIEAVGDFFGNLLVAGQRQRGNDRDQSGDHETR